jgi:hypothetical protein
MGYRWLQIQALRGNNGKSGDSWWPRGADHPFTDQSVIRMANMAYFEQQLAKTVGIGFLKPEPRIATLAPYGYVLKYFPEQVKDIPRAAFVAALQLEGVPCDGLFYEPVYRSSLFPLDPADFPALSWGGPQPLDLKTMYPCPEAEKAAYREAVWFPHQIFLVRAPTLTRSWRRYTKCWRISRSSATWITKQSATSGFPGPTARADGCDR